MGVFEVVICLCLLVICELIAYGIFLVIESAYMKHEFNELEKRDIKELERITGREFEIKTIKGDEENECGK